MSVDEAHRHVEAGDRTRRVYWLISRVLKRSDGERRKEEAQIRARANMTRDVTGSIAVPTEVGEVRDGADKRVISTGSREMSMGSDHGPQSHGERAP